MEFFYLICGILFVVGLIKMYMEKNEKIEKENQLRAYEVKKLNDVKQKELEQRKLAESRKKYQNEELERYHTLRKSIISKFDKDKNGEIDLIQGNDFGNLLKKHQSKIVEIDKTYIQKFVKISNFLSFKKKSISELHSQLFILEKINTEDISEEYWMENPRKLTP